METNKNFEGLYSISSLGRCKSFHKQTEKILSKRFSKEGYVAYSLSINGKATYKKANQLVVEAFLENPLTYPIVNHKDGIRSNDNVDNLEWCNASYNLKHAYKLKNKISLGSENGNAKLNDKLVWLIKNVFLKTKSISFIAKMLDVNHETIRCIKKGTKWKHIPFIV